MRQGRFFTIPQSPGDLDVLRRRARKLDDATRPSWLAPVDDGEYLYLGASRPKVAMGDDRSRLEAEVEELEAAGLVVSEDAGGPQVHHVYIPARPAYPEWSIGIYAGDSPERLVPADGVENPVLTRDRISDVAASFVADPFLAHVAKGSWCLFFELFNWRADKGEIGLATSSDGLRWQYVERVLTEDFHLSYPYILRAGDEFFMIPEARQSQSVRLYRARDFPVAWELVEVLLEGADVFDASVFTLGDRWWMLAGADGRQRSDTLRLFLADRLRGPWREHPGSPIVRDDPRSARPAGRVLIDRGRAIRWAQNCDPTYGLGVRGFEVTRLDPGVYSERPLTGSPLLAATGTGWNAGGMHHVDAQRVDDGTWRACVDGWAA